MAEWWETVETEEAPAPEGGEWWESVEAEAPAPATVPGGVYEERTLMDMLKGGAEVAGTVLSSAISEPLAGLSGIGGAIGSGVAELVHGDVPGSNAIDAGVAAADRTRDALTMAPDSEAGQEYLADVASFLEPVGSAVSAVEGGLGKGTLALTGNPELAALAHTAPTAVLEGLGLGFIRRGSKVSKAAEDAMRATKRVEVPPGATVEEATQLMREPEDLSYLELTEQLKQGKAKKLAEAVRPDREIMQAAEDLGVDLNPGHYSTNEAFIRVEQALKSRPDTQLDAREAEAIRTLGERADQLIEATGGEIDRGVLATRVRAEMDNTIKGLEKQSERLFSSVNEKIPPATKVSARASRALLGQRLKDMGGDVSGLSAPERALYSVLNAKRPPTYARLDQLRKDVGAGYKRQGIFKDETSGNLDQVYKALSMDQHGVADAFGVGSKLAAAQKLVSTRKGLEQNAIGLMGKDLNKSFLPKLSAAAGKLTKGEVDEFKNLMRMLPEGQRSAAAATLLGDLFTLGTRSGGASIGQGFAKAYAGLQRNPSAKAELFKYLPEATRKRFDAIGKVSQGVYRAKALENTSKTARDVLQALESASLTDKVLKGTGTAIRMTPLRWTPAAVVGDAADIALKRQKRRAEKGDELLTSGTFERAINLAMENRVREGNIALLKSKAFKAWKNTLGDKEVQQMMAVGPIAWLTQQDDPERQARAGNMPEGAALGP